MGLGRTKKRFSCNRIGDRHHALDAFVIACCTESQLEKITKLHQDIEEQKIKQRFPPPFKDCRKIVSDTLNKVFVSRAEKASTKGQAHAATLYSLKITKDEKGKEVKTIYQRKRITDKLTEEDLDNIKDPERNKDIIQSLKKWFTAGSPKDEHLLPRTAKGDIIKRVTLILKNHSGLRVPRGDSFAIADDNGKMVRTDVYKKGKKYYLVPVYVHQVAKGITPNKAIVASKPEEYWLTVDDSFEFLFSLTPNCYVIIEKKGKIDEGYFLGTDRGTTRIKLAAAYDRTKCFRVSVQKNVNKFEKYHIDRLGHLCRVKKEKKP